MEFLFKAKYGILLIVYGFGSAYLLTENFEVFDSSPMITQVIIVVLISLVGFFLIWKDRNPKTNANKA